MQLTAGVLSTMIRLADRRMQSDRTSQLGLNGQVTLQSAANSHLDLLARADRTERSASAMTNA
jgi:hypothetical protein